MAGMLRGMQTDLSNDRHIADSSKQNTKKAARIHLCTTKLVNATSHLAPVLEVLEERVQLIVRIPLQMPASPLYHISAAVH